MGKTYRHILIDPALWQRLAYLKISLGHRSFSQTINWLLEQLDKSKLPLAVRRAYHYQEEKYRTL